MLNTKRYTIIDSKTGFASSFNKESYDYICTHNFVYSEAGTIDVFNLDFEPEKFREKYSKPVYLGKNSKLFIQEDCSIPRFKLKTAVDVKTTTDYKKADWLIVSDIFLDKHCKKIHWACLLKQEDIPDVIEKIERKLKTSLQADLAEYLLILKSVETDILLLYQSKHRLSDFMDRQDIARVYHAPDDYLTYLIDNQDRVIHESAIIKMLNSGIVMDETLHNSLSKMLESGDPSNITLAMETMANCDYEKSMVYILLLIQDYGYHIRYSTTVKHVNFKSLMKYFGFTTYDLERQNIDSIVKHLNSKNLLSPENISIIAKFAKQKAHEILRLRMHSFYVSDIQFDENFIKQ